MKIIIGLGNPGTAYEHTRHNAGFIALDELAGRMGAEWKKSKKFHAHTAEIQTKDGPAILAKPQTYMNNSGIAAHALLSYYKLLPKSFGLIAKKQSDLSEVLTVIHDDVDIPLGRYKVTASSRSAGHKGVESLISHLKTQKFERIRLGIKPPPGPASQPSAKDYVLGRMTKPELEELVSVISRMLADRFKF